MQLIRIYSFTNKGDELADRIKTLCPELMCEHYNGRGEGELVDQLISDSFSLRIPMLFIGAAGIAVRKIAPYVKDKLTDSAVLVADEAGRFVVPILSGHVGGANKIAETIAQKIGAEAVITTATDVEGVFAADVFAKENGLRILNRDGIKAVSAKLLKEGRLTVAVSSDINVKVFFPGEKPPKELEVLPYPAEGGSADIMISDTLDDGINALLYLKPMNYVIGIGARKGVRQEKIHEAIKHALAICGLSEDGGDIAALASIDLKSGERGILACAAKMQVPFYTYSAEELAGTKGIFTASGFVEEKTGVDNVCERAAVCCAGAGAKLLLKKTVFDGVTIAVAQKKLKQ